MKPKILITGPPRCGKSTLISKLIVYYHQKNYKIFGFLTPEVRQKAIRIGFDIEDIYSREKARLARVGNYKTRFKLGKYHIFIEEFNQIISKLESIEGKNVDIICLDEIGKMELFSKNFQELIKKLFLSNMPILATIGQTLSHPIKDYLLKIPKIVLFNLTRQNQQEIFQKIIVILK